MNRMSKQAIPRGRPRRATEQSQLDLACAAVAHGGRRAILDHLAQAGELTVSEIATAFPQTSRQSISAHLRTLRRAKLVESQRRYRDEATAADGRERHYRASPQALVLVQQWVEHYSGFWTNKLDELALLAEGQPAPPQQTLSSAPMRTPVPVSLSAGPVSLVPLGTQHYPEIEAALVFRKLWTLSSSPMQTAQDARDYLDTALQEEASGRGVPFAILVTDRHGKPQFAGSTRFMNIAIEHGRLEIGWTWLLPQFQRSGVNRRVKFLQLMHCFEELGCRRVEFKGHARNERSRVALAGIGASFEGILRQHMRMPDGSWRDTFYCSVIAPEWPEVKARLESSIRA